MSKTTWATAVIAGIAGASIGLSLFLTTEVSHDNSTISGLEQQVSSLSTHMSDTEAQLSGAEAKLNNKSVTGDMVTCTDLRNFAGNIQITVAGTDSYGNSISGDGYVNSPWLPEHCYKQ